MTDIVKYNSQIPEIYNNDFEIKRYIDNILIEGIGVMNTIVKDEEANKYARINAYTAILKTAEFINKRIQETKTRELEIDYFDDESK